MALMNRNVDLEEIDTDAFFGVPYLDHQSLFQKIIFVIGLLCSFIIMGVGSFVLNINNLLCLLICLIPLSCSVLFGCNYNEDLSLFNYIKLVLFNPVTYLSSKPSEDIEQVKARESYVKQAESNIASKQGIFTEEHKKRVFRRILLAVGGFILLFIVLVIYLFTVRSGSAHHSVTSLINMYYMQV